MADVDKNSNKWKQLSSIKSIEKVFCKRADREKLNIFVLSVLKGAGKTVRQNVFNHLVERIGYEKDTEMSLYSVGNLLSNLCVAYEDTELTLDMVDEIIPIKECEDRFGMAELLDSKDSVALYSQCHLLTKEPGVIAFLSLLSRDFRVAYKMKIGFTYNDIGASTKHFTDWSREELLKSLEILAELIAQSKDGSLPEDVIIPMAFQRILEVRKEVTNDC